jgi:hypothetical protein
MTGHQGPGVDCRSGLDCQLGETIEEVTAVPVGTEDLATLDATDDDVMEGTGMIEARAARRGPGLEEIRSICQVYITTRRYVPKAPVPLSK